MASLSNTKNTTKLLSDPHLPQIQVIGSVINHSPMYHFVVLISEKLKVALKINVCR